MPFQAPSWTEFYTCPICENEFSTNQRLPISLGCGHTICRVCLATVYSRQCPFDQTSISTDIDNLPINNALLQLINSGDGTDYNGNGNGRTNSTINHSASASNVASTSTKVSSSGGGYRKHSSFGNYNDNECPAADLQMPPSVRNLKPEDLKCYKSAKKCIEELAQYLKSFVTNSGNTLLTRPMLRKLVTLVNCQLMEEEGRIRAVRTARFLGERTVTELLLQHQNPQQLSLCLWAAVRSRGCQFLGPSMQEEVLKLVLQALQNGTALSRKVLVMFVVQRLIDNLLPASKTSIGHVVQLLYRASCFKVSKREGDSSLMQLKEEFRNYESLRREHDAQIVQIATEAGLRIAPDQWSSLLYGNTSHKPHMQSICDTLQTPSSFAQSVQELVLALQRTGDPTNLSNLRPHLKHLASIDPLPETPPPSWQDVEKALDAVRHVVLGLVKFMQYQSNRKVQDYPMPPLNANGKYKISLCRDLIERRMCPRGTNCTFAHSAEERQRYRAKHRRTDKAGSRPLTSSTVAQSGSLHMLDNIKNEYAANHQLQLNTVGPHSHMTQQNTSLNSSTENGNSPVRLKPSSMRNYNSTNDNIGNISIMRSTMLEPTGYVGDISNTTSPLHMQSTANALHASPIPTQGHLLGITAPGSIINVPPIPKQTSHNYENMPAHFSPMNFGGKYVRMPNMRMPLTPNLRPPNLRGPISSSNGGMIGAGGGGLSGQGITSPRSSVINPINITTVVNPPNIQGTNSNKPSGSPIHKNIYNNSTISVDFYNTGQPHHPPSYFTNMESASAPDFPYRMSKQKIQKTQSNVWDVSSHQQLQQQQCQSLINHSEFTPNHHLIFMPQSPHQNQQHTSAESSNSYFDKNSMDLNKMTTKSNPSDSNLHVSPDNFMYKHSESNKSKPKISIAPMHDKSNMFWNMNSSNNLQHQSRNMNTNIKSNHFGNASSDASIDGASTSLFRDRDSFVRSDSILDDDAATFDVPPTSTGNKYGPICPMYKGLTSSLPPQSANSKTTNTFVDSWNALISQTSDDEQCAVTPSNANNMKDFTVFSLDDDNTLKMQITNHSAQSCSDHFSDPHTSAASRADAATSSPLSNFDNMQAALSKLSFINDSGNDQQQQNLNHFDFDLNSMYNILGGQNYHGNITKTSSMNDDLLWNNSNMNNVKTTSMNLGLNSFWSDNITVSSGTSTTSPTTLIGSNIPSLSHQKHPNQDQQAQRLSQKLDENELDITEIVDHIWPCGDDSGIKLD